MGTSVRLNAGARLYRDGILTSNVFTGTTWARISPDPFTTCAIVDMIQGPNSVVGRSGSFPIMGSWNHGTVSAHDGCTSAPNVDNVDPYHSFFWFGLVDGFLQLEVFDGRPTAGVLTLRGSGTNLVVTSSARVPTAPACCHVAFVASWASSAGAVGTYTLYVDGVAVGSGTTNASSSHGLGDFFLDFPSFTVGTAKDGYRPQVGSVRLMDLRGATYKWTAAQLLGEANSPCATTLAWDKFNYPFNTASGIKHSPPSTGENFTLEVGTIDLTAPDCCPPPFVPVGGTTILPPGLIFPGQVLLPPPAVCPVEFAIDPGSPGLEDS